MSARQAKAMQHQEPKECFHFRMPAHLHQYLQDRADQEGISKAALLVRLIRDHKKVFLKEQ